MARPRAPAAPEPGLDPAALFARLADARGLILAVSGGPDSTALMWLMTRWPARPPALVVTVDHGLRPEAADEARAVAANAARLGLPFRVMRVAAGYSGGNLQDWARRARYGCLAAAAREAGFNVVVTAHHRDDQAETLLLRLARGSGVYGLAAMAEETVLDGLRLARPLLGVPRAALSALAAASGLEVATDPGNEDERFARIRMRKLAPALAEAGLGAARLAGAARNLGRAAAALDHYAGELLRAHVAAGPFGAARGDVAGFARAPEEVGLRALARLLRAVGGASYTPRLDRLEGLRAAMLAAGGGGPMRRSLHGVLIGVADGVLTAEREWGRLGPPTLAAASGAPLIWDGRFRVAAASALPDLSIGALGRSDRRLSGEAIGAAGLRLLPGLFSAGRLVAAPAAVAATDGGDRLDPLIAHCIVGERLGLGGRAHHDRAAPLPDRP